MERYNSRKIDELGRISLHYELRRKLGILHDGEVSLTTIDSIVILQRVCVGGCKVSPLGAVTIPEKIRNKMAWTPGSEVAVYHTDALVILKAT